MSALQMISVAMVLLVVGVEAYKNTGSIVSFQQDASGTTTPVSISRDSIETIWGSMTHEDSDGKFRSYPGTGTSTYGWNKTFDGDENTYMHSPNGFSWSKDPTVVVVFKQPTNVCQFTFTGRSNRNIPGGGGVNVNSMPAKWEISGGTDAECASFSSKCGADEAGWIGDCYNAFKALLHEKTDGSTYWTEATPFTINSPAAYNCYKIKFTGNYGSSGGNNYLLVSEIQLKTCGDADCAVGEWANWGSCSKTCGSGEQSRTRTLTQATGGGMACPASTATEEIQACSTVPCPVDCTLGGWEAWTACSTTCGSGTQSRSRNVQQFPANGGQPCPSALSQTEACSGLSACPVDCEVDDWGQWSVCSTTCGSGTMSRTRSITQQPANGGASCLTLSDHGACDNAATCPPVSTASDSIEAIWGSMTHEDSDGKFRSYPGTGTSTYGWNKTFDGDENTYMHSPNGFTWSKDPTVVVVFKQPTNVCQFTFTGRSNRNIPGGGGVNENSMPAKWEISGGTDEECASFSSTCGADEAGWIGDCYNAFEALLHEKTDGSKYWTEATPFTINSPAAYKCYKIKFTGNYGSSGGNNYLLVSEIQLRTCR